MNFTVTPTDATLGAVITDINLGTLDDDSWVDLYQAFETYFCHS